MEDSILGRKRFLWIGIGLGIVSTYILMLMSDLSLTNRTEKERKIEGLSMQGVSFWKKLEDNRVLNVYAAEMMKSDDNVSGKDIRVKLLTKEGKFLILSVEGKTGIYNVNKGVILLKGDISGIFRKIKWESNSLIWDLASNEIKSSGEVNFQMDKLKGHASEMIIDLKNEVFIFCGGVDIKDLGGASN